MRSRPIILPRPTSAFVAALALCWACAHRPSPPANAAASDSSTRAEVLLTEFVSLRSPAPSVHASTIVEHRGRLLIAWFAGSYESANDVGIWLTGRGTESDTAWSVPIEVANGLQPDGRRFPTWNPVLFAPDERSLLLYYKVGPNPREWWGVVRRSIDGGRTWSAESRLADGVLGPIKNKPVRLRSGTIVSPSSTEAPDSANAWRVHFERSRDGGDTWQRIAPRATPDGGEFDAIQPAILVHRDGRVQALARTRGPARIASTWSTDEGRSWSPLELLDLPNPNSGIDAATLRDGRHLLVYNNTTEGRTPLEVALSRDGLAWSPLITLEREPGEYSYPAIIQSRDGTVHITWTWRRQRIKHVALRLR